MISAYFSFFWKNYLRSHRYLRELIIIVIFNIFFSGFLYGPAPEDAVWSVFGVFALLINFATVPSIFYLEKGNSIYFPLIRENGRRKMFIAKFLLIVLINMGWLFLFALIYGLRFMDAGYFSLLLPRLLSMLLIILLSTAITSLAYTFRPWATAPIFILVVIGAILNKVAWFPIDEWGRFYRVFAFLAPPFLEYIYSAIRVEWNFWRIIFVLNGLLQTAFYLALNIKLLSRKDFI